MTRTNYAPPADLGGFQTRALIVGFVGLVIYLVGAFVTGQKQLIFQSYLVAYIFWTGISLGCLGLLMIQYLGGAGWGLLIRRILESGAYTLLLMAVGFIVIAVGMWKGGLYEWVHPEGALKVLMDKSAFKAWWLNPNWFIARAVIYFAIWIGFMWLLRSNSHKQDETGDPALLVSSQKWSGLGFFLFAIALTFAAIDWVMSLDAEWFSTILEC